MDLVSLYNKPGCGNSAARAFSKMSSEELKPVIQVFEELRKSLCDTLINASEMELIYRTQGHLQMIDSFLETVAAYRGRSS